MGTKNKLPLTSNNYYSLKADNQYMSVSQLKNWIECEAATKAYLKGEITKEPTGAMLVGSYTHAAFEGDKVFNQFIEENNGVIFKKNGGKYADYEQADLMIESLKNDPFASFAMSGEKEQIVTANLLGIDWKCKIDNVNHQHQFFSDLKTTQDLYKRYWSEKYDGWVSFIERWDYVLQMAIYRKLIEQNTGQLYTPYIVAVTKEKTPNKAVVHFEESRFDFEYEWAEMKLERVMEVKYGNADPVACGKCDYCRSVKELNGTIEVGALIYE